MIAAAAGQEEKRLSTNAKFLVLTGPSGAGLGEIVEKLFAARDDVTSVVPVTARKMKAGEVDGIGFHFYDLDGWNALKESGDLLEATEFAGNDYGTSRRLVEEQLSSGKHVVLSLEAARAVQIKQNMPEAICIFITPSTPQRLQALYEATARSRFEVTARMELAEKESELARFCDATVYSDNEEGAVNALSLLLGN